MNTSLSNNQSLKQNPILFAFTAPAAREVMLAGSFNKWNPKAMPMRKSADGVWQLSVPLTPGRYEYRFVADGVWQDDPAAKQRIANALGGQNCVRTVAD
jgi:1,4-alpha-glucan branching enzyme